jgi:hypothetical protein
MLHEDEGRRMTTNSKTSQSDTEKAQSPLLDPGGFDIERYTVWVSSFLVGRQIAGIRFNGSPFGRSENHSVVLELEGGGEVLIRPSFGVGMRSPLVPKSYGGLHIAEISSPNVRGVARRRVDSQSAAKERRCPPLPPLSC